MHGDRERVVVTILVPPVTWLVGMIWILKVFWFILDLVFGKRSDWASILDYEKSLDPECPKFQDCNRLYRRFKKGMMVSLGDLIWMLRIRDLMVYNWDLELGRTRLNGRSCGILLKLGLSKTRFFLIRRIFLIGLWLINWRFRMKFIWKFHLWGDHASQSRAGIGRVIKLGAGRYWFLHLDSLNKFSGVFFQISHTYTIPRVFFVRFKDWEMPQSELIVSGTKMKADIVRPKLKITVPRFDNTDLIRGYSKTIIGRCMNPRAQDMKALLYMLPRIWKMEEHVAGADLGLGKFQFDFDSEEDLKEVLQMEPFHFDYWMLSLVRWRPGMDRSEPSKIMFWVRVIDLQLEWWAEPTFRSIGDALGEVAEDGVDIDNGRVRVLLDGFKPMVFETEITFYTGAHATVGLRYEKLYGYCRRCHSLCHDADFCPTIRGNQEKTEYRRQEEQKKNIGDMKSYKGALHSGKREDFNGRHKEEDNRKDIWGKTNGQAGISKFQYRRIPNKGLGERRDKNLMVKGTTSVSPMNNSASPTGSLGGAVVDTMGKENLNIPSRDDTTEVANNHLLDGPSGQDVSTEGAKSLNKEGEVESRRFSDEFMTATVSDLVPEKGVDKQTKVVMEGMILTKTDNQEEGEVLTTEQGELEETEQNSEGHEEGGKEDTKAEEEHIERGKEEKKHGIRKNLFPPPVLYVGRIAKKRMIQTLASPRKGVPGKGKGKPKKGAEEEGDISLYGVRKVVTDESGTNIKI